ncbi:P-loop containing nucleoside triphosphate hydrolase protein [Lanmaoa asiatica]|nr:P-loop containing nucleoside triphosphate hydrolase protein [Lanmaoa asiatica]
MPKTATLMPGSMVQPSMAFSQGGEHLMLNKKCKLLNGSFKHSRKGFEEIHVPMPKNHIGSGDELVHMAKSLEWAWAAFTVPKLHRVQSKLFPVAFGADKLLLLCAPTGTGKTNVAMLTILNELARYRDEETGGFALDQFKIVYVAPMKALVQEMVGDFTSRLTFTCGVKVGKLTGDSNDEAANLRDPNHHDNGRYYSQEHGHQLYESCSPYDHRQDPPIA